MARIWANRLEAGTQQWENCPERYKASVKELLKSDVVNGVITADEYKNITGEPYEG